MAPSLASGLGMSAHLAGQLTQWPTKQQMASVLRQAGLDVIVGQYSLRVTNCSHFVFQEYGGDLGDPVVDADAETPEELLRQARFVSLALARAGLRHRFEVYNEHGELTGDLHHDWPREPHSRSE